MKKFTIIIGIVICVLLCACTLVGCVESYNVDEIDTDLSAAKEISSNGGLAVKAGKYLYYINGYAGNEVDNVFGDVQKGAIARVEIKDGALDMSTNQIIVPKNVYNTLATSGLYIDGEYIYYSTYSIAKDGDGEADTDKMWLMRTKLDGTDTDVIKEFDDFTAQYKVANGYVVYYLEKELHAINTGKRNKDTLIDEDVSSVLFTEDAEGANSFTDTVFYIKSAENDDASNNVVWGYRAGGEKKELIEAKESYTNLLYAGGYTITLKEAKYVGDNVRLIYTKSDSGSNTISKGTYSYDFDSTMTFNADKEYRYTIGTEITSLYFLNDNDFIALNGTNVAWYQKNGDNAVEKATLITASSAPTIMSVEDDGEKVRIYYVTSDNHICAINVLKHEGASYVTNITTAEDLYSGAYDTTWLKYDKVDGNVYFFNEDVLNYTYYVTLTELKAHNADSQVPNLLSLVTAEDEITMLTESSDD